MGLSDRRRRSLLSLVLLAVLGISVLAAWILVQQRRAPMARAAAILQRIRDKTLLPYWGQEEATRWFLMQDSAGRAVGYTARFRKPTAEGYVGMTVVRTGDIQHGETWSLNAAATKGFYTATIGGRGVIDTQIVLGDGKVTVVKPWAGQAGRAGGPVPENYIPEGLLTLVAAEVSKTSGEARFCFVYDRESIIQGEIYFTNVTMTPQGDGKVRLRSKFLQGQMDEIYHIDAQGEVFGIDYHTLRASSRLIDLHSLAKEFPEVLDIQRGLEEEEPEPSDDADVEEPAPTPSRENQEARIG